MEAMGKRLRTKNDNSTTDEILDRLQEVTRKQNHLHEQIEHVIRLIQGDNTLNTIGRPNGIINDLKDIDTRLVSTQKEVMGVVKWFQERSKKKWIIEMDIVVIGKVLLWMSGIVGTIIAYFIWREKK